MPPELSTASVRADAAKGSELFDTLAGRASSTLLAFASSVNDVERSSTTFDTADARKVPPTLIDTFSDCAMSSESKASASTRTRDNKHVLFHFELCDRVFSPFGSTCRRIQ